MNQRVRLALMLAGGLFLSADRIFKFLSLSAFSKPHLVNQYLGWLPSGNRGIAFGIPLPNPLIIALSLVFIIILSWFFKKNSSLAARSGIFLMLVGALSNLADRVYYGHTLDYLLVYLSIFNLADVLIVAGAFICALSLARQNPGPAATG